MGESRSQPADRQELPRLPFGQEGREQKDLNERSNAGAMLLADASRSQSRVLIATRPGDKPPAAKPQDQGDVRPQVPPDLPETAQSAAMLRSDLERRATQLIPNNERRAEFIKDLQDFSARMQHSPSENCRTLNQVNRILGSENPDKVKVAREVVRNAARPTSIDQGAHNTCNVTALECRLYTRTPSLPAKIVADLMVTGQFVTADGTVVRPHSLKPDVEANQDPVPDGKRNHASSLFQVTAANIYWNRQTNLPNGRHAGLGNIFYAQDENASKPDEYLLDCSVNPPQRFTLTKLTADNPHLEMSQLLDINAQITGRREEDLAIVGAIFRSNDKEMLTVTSANELKTTLERLKAQNKFPVLIKVDASLPPFGAGTAAFAPHAVTITDYDPATGAVYVDNQWGSHNDYHGRGNNRAPIHYETLYGTMRPIPTLGGLGNQLWNNVKQINLKDIERTARSSIPAAALYAGLSGSASEAIRGGLRSIHEGGNLTAGRWLTAAESTTGRIALRAGTSLGALGAVAYANDLPAAFAQSPEYGSAKLLRTGIVWCTFDLGMTAGTNVAKMCGVTKGLGKYAMALTGGLVLATAFDAAVGDGLEFLGSSIYRNTLGRKTTDQLDPNLRLSR